MSDYCTNFVIYVALWDCHVISLVPGSSALRLVHDIGRPSPWPLKIRAAVRPFAKILMESKLNPILEFRGERQHENTDSQIAYTIMYSRTKCAIAVACFCLLDSFDTVAPQSL